MAPADIECRTLKMLSLICSTPRQTVSASTSVVKSDTPRAILQHSITVQATPLMSICVPFLTWAFRHAKILTYALNKGGGISIGGNTAAGRGSTADVKRSGAYLSQLRFLGSLPYPPYPELGFVSVWKNLS